MIKDSIRCYQILGVEPGDSAQKVRNAYVELMRTWDPERYVANPRLLDETKKKRLEIDEAYESIRFFLPELSKDPDAPSEVKWISSEEPTLTIKPPMNRTRVLLGILLACVVAFVSLWARRLFEQGRQVAPAQATDVPAEP